MTYSICAVTSTEILTAAKLQWWQHSSQKSVGVEMNTYKLQVCCRMKFDWSKTLISQYYIRTSLYCNQRIIIWFLTQQGMVFEQANPWLTRAYVLADGKQTVINLQKELWNESKQWGGDIVINTLSHQLHSDCVSENDLWHHLLAEQWACVIKLTNANQRHASASASTGSAVSLALPVLALALACLSENCWALDSVMLNSILVTFQSLYVSLGGKISRAHLKKHARCPWKLATKRNVQTLKCNQNT